MGQMKRIATEIEIRLARLGRDEQHCEHCVWDGVAYWEGNTPVAQWIYCEACNWGNE